MINPAGHAAAGQAFLVIHIETGDYLTFDNLDLDGSNATADPGGSAGVLKTGDIQGLVIQNSKLHGSCCGNNITSGSANSQYLHNEVYNAAGYGFYLGRDNNVMDNNYIHDHAGFGIHIYNGSPGHRTEAHNNIVRNNYLRHNGFNNQNPAGSCALLLSSGDNNRACNNIIADHNGCGLQVYGNSTSAKVFGNTITGNAAACIDINPGATQALVRGNTCTVNGGGIQDAGTATVVDATDAAALKDDCGGTPFARPRPAPKEFTRCRYAVSLPFRHQQPAPLPHRDPNHRRAVAGDICLLAGAPRRCSVGKGRGRAGAQDC